jgi:hypothetical protein
VQQQPVKGGIMSAVVFAVLAVIVVVPFIAVVTATMLVTGSVRIEERHQTLTGPAPGPGTQLARSLLAVPSRYLAQPREAVPAPDQEPEEAEPAWIRPRAGQGSR